MKFQIRGKRYEIAREDVIIATRNVSPDIPDGRYKYFVKLHNRHFPIKQVIRLATSLTSDEFISDTARRILRDLGFDESLSDRSTTPRDSDRRGRNQRR